jgi:hypothetical protein
MTNLSKLAGAVYYPELEHAPLSVEDKKLNRLMIKPLQDFTPDDVRILTEHKLYLEHILPIALRFLQQDLFTKAKFYEGDVLVAVCELLPQDIPQSLQTDWQNWIQFLTDFKNSPEYKNIPDNIIQRKITICIKQHTAKKE